MIEVGTAITVVRRLGFRVLVTELVFGHVTYSSDDGWIEWRVGTGPVVVLPRGMSFVPNMLAKGEHLHWIRGHHNEQSPEGKALLAAFALVAA